MPSCLWFWMETGCQNLSGLQSHKANPLFFFEKLSFLHTKIYKNVWYLTYVGWHLNIVFELSVNLIFWPFKFVQVFRTFTIILIFFRDLSVLSRFRNITSAHCFDPNIFMTQDIRAVL